MDLTKYVRRKAHEVRIGGVKIGSDYPDWCTRHF